MFSSQLTSAILILLLAANSFLLTAQSTAESQWIPQLDRVGTDFAAQNYKSASRLLIPIVSDLMRKNQGRPLPSRSEMGDIAKDELGVSNALRKLRMELNQGDFASALKTAFGLGMSLNYLDSSQSPQTRLRQERLATTETTTGRASIVTASQQMLTAYRAGEFTEAARLARHILNTQATLEPYAPGVARFIHNANTILGLLALNNNDPAQARQFLTDSISTLKPDATISSGQPSLALAEALLKRNEKPAVLAYLAACARLNAWTQSKAKLANYNQEILAGTRTTFAPDDFLLF